MKEWGTPYFNLIDQIFAQYGLPRELKYLAVIESNLNSGATSWVGAGGPMAIYALYRKRIWISSMQEMKFRVSACLL